MNINLNLDYENLFSSLSSSSGSNSTNSLSNINLSDYASIKNGSYGRLMTAYYKKTDSEESSSTSSDSSKTTASIQSASDSLVESANTLLEKGADSLFSKKDVTTANKDGTKVTSYGYDTNAIYDAVSTFVDDYNSLVENSAKSNNTNVLRQASSMTSTTDTYSNLLASVGITIDSENKLSIDEKTFKSADMTTIKSIFNGTGSYAYNMSAKASQIDYYATREAEKANTYDSSGTYSSSNSTGSIFTDYV